MTSNVDIVGTFNQKNSITSLTLSATMLSSLKDACDDFSAWGYADLFNEDKFVERQYFKKPNGDFAASDGYFGSCTFDLPNSGNSIYIDIYSSWSMKYPEGIVNLTPYSTFRLN